MYIESDYVSPPAQHNPSAGTFSVTMTKNILNNCEKMWPAVVVTLSDE